MDIKYIIARKLLFLLLSFTLSMQATSQGFGKTDYINPLNLSIKTSVMVEESGGHVYDSEQSHFSSRLNIRYMPNGKKDIAGFGGKWCPYISLPYVGVEIPIRLNLEPDDSDNTELKTPLSWSIMPEANNKKVVKLIHCMNFDNPIYLTLVEAASSPVNGRDLKEILSGNIKKGEQFNFVKRGATINQFKGETIEEINQSFQRNNRNLTLINVDENEIFVRVNNPRLSFILDFKHDIIKAQLTQDVVFIFEYDLLGKMSFIKYKGNVSLYDQIVDKSKNGSTGVLFDLKYNKQGYINTVRSYSSGKADNYQQGFDFDSSNRLLSMKELNDNGKPSVSFPTIFSYDGLGRLSGESPKIAYFYQPSTDKANNESTLSAMVHFNGCLFTMKYLSIETNHYKTTIVKTCNGEKTLDVETTVAPDPVTKVIQVRQTTTGKFGVNKSIDSPLEELKRGDPM